MIFRPALLFALTIWISAHAIGDSSLKALVREANSLPATDGVATMSFSQDSKRLAVGGLSGRVIVYNTNDDRKFIDATAHSASVWTLSFSPDGHLFCSAGTDGIAVVWRIDGKVEEIGRLKAPIKWFVHTANGEFLFASAKGAIFKWAERSPKIFQKIAPYPGKIATYTQPVLKDNRDLILTDFGDVLEFDISQKILKRSVSVSKYSISKSCISHDRKFLLTISGGFDGSILTFSDFKVKSIGKVEKLSVGISPKDKFGIFLGASDIGGPSFVSIRSLEDGESVFGFETPTSYVMAVSPDGNMIAIGGAESQPNNLLTDIKVFDLTALWEKLE